MSCGTTKLLREGAGEVCVELVVRPEFGLCSTVSFCISVSADSFWSDSAGEGAVLLVALSLLLSTVMIMAAVITIVMRDSAKMATVGANPSIRRSRFKWTMGVVDGVVLDGSLVVGDGVTGVMMVVVVVVDGSTVGVHVTGSSTSTL